MRRLFLVGSLFLVLLGVAYSTFTLQCEWRSVSCDPSEVDVLYAHPTFTSDDSPFSLGEILSSPVSIENIDARYNSVLCCSSPFSNLNFTTIPYSSSCPSNSQEVMYTTNYTNARLAVQNSPLFDIGHYSHKICLEKPPQFATIDMFINRTNSHFPRIGYSCVYRTSDLVNGLVSSCDATFNNGDMYEYTVFTRMWETESLMECNSDCTSKLDGRVYSACSGSIEVCRGINPACDGSLYGSWVVSNETIQEEVQCSAPWDNFRGGFGAFEDIEITTEENQCNNLIIDEQQVLIDNQITTLKILICRD